MEAAFEKCTTERGLAQTVNPFCRRTLVSKVACRLQRLCIHSFPKRVRYFGQSEPLGTVCIHGLIFLPPSLSVVLFLCPRRSSYITTHVKRLYLCQNIHPSSIAVMKFSSYCQKLCLTAAIFHVTATRAGLWNDTVNLWNDTVTDVENEFSKMKGEFETEVAKEVAKGLAAVNGVLATVSLGYSE